MLKIGNFYEYGNLTHELVEINNENYVFQNLYNQHKITATPDKVRETEFNKIHLERLGLLNKSIDDVHVVQVAVLLGKDIQNLSYPFFGYLVFHTNDIANIQPKYNEAITEIHLEYNKNGVISYDFIAYIHNKLKTIFSINDLFEKLNEKGINIENKLEIIIR